MSNAQDKTTEPCPEGHQWHDTTSGKVCAACLLEAPADPIKPDADDDPKHQTTDHPEPFHAGDGGYWFCVSDGMTPEALNGYGRTREEAVAMWKELKIVRDAGRALTP